MLVISRKVNESILLIQDDIEITVLDISGGQVKLGISAPGSKKIVRKEIIEQVARENNEAAVDSSTIDLDSISDRIEKK